MDGAFRAVARLVRRGLVAPSGAVAPGAELTVEQMRDYVRALYAWNPDVVEESDFEGRRKGELAEFLARYAAAPELVNRVRDVPAPENEGQRSMDRLMAHLRGREKAETKKRKPKPEDAEEGKRLAEEAKRLAEEAALRHEREEQARVARREALNMHRDLRVKRDALRDQIHAALVLDIRRRRIDADIERAEARIAALTADILGSEAENAEAEGRIDGCQTDLEALAREHASVCADSSVLPFSSEEGGLDATLTRLLLEVRDLEEEQELMTDRVSKADVALLVAAIENRNVGK